MKIHSLSKNINGDLVRVSATITWEDCDRPEKEIYIETDARFAKDISCNPHTFLLIGIMPAMRHGERRVLIDGKVCPELRNGLITAMQQLRVWYGEERHGDVKIEAKKGFEPPPLRWPKQTASFMSGGVDSLATLRANRIDFPLDHPNSIKDCFFVHGLDVGGYEILDNNLENSKQAVASLSEFAKNTKISLIPVYTNIRHIDDNDYFFFADFYGAVLASIAHSFSGRITTAMIAAGSSILDLGPIGSHPLLDPNYSSADVSIRHDGIRFSRLEKVGLISGWDDAIHTLRACFDAFRPGDALNCGKCEKCIRTMTELLVYDKLNKCSTYPLNDITPDLLETIMAAPPKDFLSHSRKKILQKAYLMLGVANVYYWRELVNPLRKINRHDLAEVVETKLKKYEKYKARVEGKDLKGLIKRFDRKYLGSILSRLNQIRRKHL